VTPLFLAPLDEIAAAAQLPRQLRLDPTLSIAIVTRGTDDLDDSGSSHPRSSNDTIIQTGLPMTVAVGKLGMVQDMRTSMPGYWRNYIGLNGLNELIYQTRADWHYMPGAAQCLFMLRHGKELAGIPITPGGDIDLQALGKRPLDVALLNRVWKKHAKELQQLRKSEIMRAVYWEQRCLDAVDDLPPARRLDASANDYRMMAFYYKAAGDAPAMRRALKAQLAIFRRIYPMKSTLVRQVEYEIKTGRLASKSDYRGPS
jgi:hypothetical protein